MSSKEELYKLLLENSPYGTLFFAYGICVDSNPKAREILGCEKRALQGVSIEDTALSEPLALISLKQQINIALDDGLSDFDWQLTIGDTSENIALHIQQVGDGGKELIVTLTPDGAPESSFLDDDASGRGSADSSALPIITPPATEPVVNGDLENAATVDLSAVSQSSILDKLTGSSADIRRHMPGLDRDVYFDSLTGLPSRQLLIETIRQHQKETSDQEICAALMLIDLDHFKDINDSWGHEVGDQVLFKVARAIEPIIDDTAMVARMSGDEFMLFFPYAGDDLAQGSMNANTMATRVKEAIAHPIFYDGNEFILTASVGIALLSDHDTSAERALQYADTAMYEAKRKGRNGIAFFNQSIIDKAQRQIGLNTRLRKAVDNQEFALYVQPQIDVRDGRVMGGEALLRWVNADRVTNMPSEFIPLLESSGLIVDVGHWVIRTACEYIRNFLDEGLWQDHMRLGINISPRQFNDPQLLEVIEHSLRSYEIDPQYLNFEVTESLMIEDVEDVIKKMSAIKDLGAQFSIDDFGIGYSSMIYLKRLPFDWLKIDREFIHNIHKDPESRGVVEAILAVSRQYGLHVTAEGVEDLESLEVLRKVGCDTYQGAHFSMPVPVDQFRNYLAA
ncbi:MAG: EAL domain-containing protein [Porticoccaceae bacterium]|nr:EAL domain-containing protein [Porticoccaceae bacterium]